MNRTEFIVATAILLFAAVLIGWFAHWIVHRLTRVSRADLGELDRMAQALHEAEEERDRAVAYLQEREAELTQELHRTEARLRAAIDDLRHVRSENDEMRAYVDRLSARR